MGRKKMVGTSAQKAEIRIRLEQDFFEEVQAAVKAKRHASVADFVRVAIAEKLERIRKEDAK